ncbi:MAG: hypothetical protein IJ410_01175 [Oscillospiraceae bacterium]|nr:hypothetical protein [Oscillospiraceae bacterium]
MDTFIGVTAFTTAALPDWDYIISILMVIIGFVIMKKCRKSLFLNIGRLIFALGWGMIVWMIMWQITPVIMAEIIYGVRV